MPNPAQWSAIATNLNQLGLSNAAADAMHHASEADAEERADSAKLGQLRSDYQALQANIRAGKERARLAGGSLPDGFVPIKELKALTKLGAWPFLQGDAVPVWWPIRTFAEMGKRSNNGDKDAKAWFSAWNRALSGDAAALREMGEITEKGRYGANIDLDRAFFWYFRAGLAGDTIARTRAVELKRSNEIDPATMDDPHLIAAGNYRITMDNFGQASTTAMVEFELAQVGVFGGGTLSGSVESFGGAAMGMMNSAMAGDEELQAFVSSLTQSMVIEGRWTYDPKRYVLSLDMMFSAPTVPGAQSLSAQIQILGRKVVGKESLMGGEKYILFGRDKTMAAYYFEYVVQRN
jgi:hypothetical protein